jgi:phage-related minor tail protein
MSSSQVFSVGIRVTADVAGVTAALPQAQRALDTLGERADQSSARASRGLGQVAGAAKAAGNELQGLAARSAQAQAMGEGFLAGLRDQVATFGKSTDELLRHRAAQLGVGQEASNLILQFQNQRAAQAAAAQAAQAEAQAQREAAQAKQAQASAQASFLAGLREQVAVQGLSAADTLRYRAAQLGVAEGAESYIAALAAANQGHMVGAKTAGEHAQALRMLPMQFTDVAVSIASGMPVWMVAMQQGGQIKDSFGSAGVAAREMGRYVLGLVNPLTLGAVALGVVAAGAYAGAQESSALQNAIIGSGNAAGVTAGQLMGMAAGVDAVVGTQGRAAEVLAALVSTGQVGATQLEAFTVAALRMEAVGGAAAEETAQRFAELGKAPLEASIKLNESMNYLTASTYRQIKALMDQGRTTEAARVAQEAFADTLANRASQMETNLGLVERGWRGVKWAVTEAWDAIKGIGRDAGPEGQLAVESDAIDRLKAQIETRKAAGVNTQLLDAELAKMRERQSVLQSEIRLRKSAADAQAVQAVQAKNAEQLVAWDRASSQYASTQQQRESELRKARIEGQALVNAGLITEADLKQRIAAIEAKHSDAAPGRQRGLTEAEKALREEQKRSADVVALRNKLVGEAYDANQKLIESAQDLYAAELKTYTDSAASAQQRLQDLTQQANAVAYAEAHQISLAQAVEYTTIARLKEQQIAERHTEAAVTAIQAEIDRRQKIIGVLSGNEAREAGNAARKTQLDAWNNTWTQVADGFTDAMMRGGDSVKQYLIDLFKRMVLRPILAPIGSGFAGMLGGPAAAGQAGGAGGAGDALGTLGGLAGLSSAFGTGMAASFNSAMAAGVSGWATAAGSLIGTGTASGIAAGAGMIAAPIAAIYAGFQLSKAIAGDYRLGGLSADANALFGGLPARMFGRKLQSSGIQGEFGGAAGFAGENFEQYKGGWFRSDKTKTSGMDLTQSTLLGQQFAANRAAVVGQAATLGQSAAAIEAYTRRVKVNTKGLSEADAAKAWQAEFEAANEDMASLALGTTEWSRTGETAVQTLGRLSTSLSTVNQISDTLGWALHETSLAGGDAASAFAEIFGGLEAMGTATSAYYEAYYTDAERSATATRQLTQTLADLGVALPASRDAYRDLIDNALASGNDQLAADLIKLSGAYAAVSQSTDELRSSISSLVQTLADATAKAREQVSQSVASIAGLPGPTLAELRGQVAQQQVSLPSSTGVVQGGNALTAAYAVREAREARADVLRDLVAKATTMFSDAYYELRDLEERWIPLANIQVNTAQATLTAAQEAYATALRGYAVDATNAVEKLSALREKTEAYYQAQKQLADGMLASSQQLRTAAQTMRYGQLSTGQTLALQQAEFAQAYSLALSTTGTVQAGYADKMAALLPSLSEAVRASTSSRTEWAVATAGLYAQSQRVANSVAANVPQDYQAESLAVLGQIDGTLAAIEAATSSAEKIISDAIFESGGQTLAGLRGVIAAIKGETIPAFATGAAFSGGVVSRPTFFNTGLMGEAGPEAIVPLGNVGGKLGVHLAGGLGQAEVVAELRATRAVLALMQAELAGLRAVSGETALATRRMARDTKSWSLDGLAVKNKADEPLFTAAVSA